MYPGNAVNFKRPKGGVYIKLWEDASTPPGDSEFGNELGDCSDVSLELSDVQNIRKRSATQNNSPILLDEVLEATHQLVCQCSEHQYRNLEMYMLGTRTETAQTLGVAQTFTIDEAVPGESYNIGARRITNVSVMFDTTNTAVEGEDYDLYPVPGIIKIRETGSIPEGVEVVVTFNKPARTIERIAGGTSLNRLVKVVVQADDANTSGVGATQTLTIWKASVTAEGPYRMAQESATEFVGYTLRFTVLDEPINHSGEPFRLEMDKAA